MPHKADRWVAEMEEIAATFASVWLTPLMVPRAAAEDPSSVADHRSPPRRDAVMRTGATAQQDIGALLEGWDAA